MHIDFTRRDRDPRGIGEHPFVLAEDGLKMFLAEMAVILIVTHNRKLYTKLVQANLLLGACPLHFVHEQPTSAALRVTIQSSQLLPQVFTHMHLVLT